MFSTLLQYCRVGSDLIKERIRAGMRRPADSKVFVLDDNRWTSTTQALVRDRMNGMSLTDMWLKKYGVSRASVVRFVRESQKQFAGVELRH